MIRATSGFAAGDTGHAEVVQVDFDPTRMPYEHLLAWFWKLHDPTTLNRQGADVGTQYRSVIFWHDESQRDAAIASKTALEKSGTHAAPVVTEISEATTFWAAEGYHHDFYAQNKGHGYCRAVIAPQAREARLRVAQPCGFGRAGIRLSTSFFFLRSNTVRRPRKSPAKTRLPSAEQQTE